MTTRPGAPGVGDPYFPLDGNGGYDVSHYDLDLRYNPATDQARRTQRSTPAPQNLSRFDLDFVGLTVRRSPSTGGATWTRDGQELVVTPPGLPKGTTFTEVVLRRGPGAGRRRPRRVRFPRDGRRRRRRRATHVAATWFPVNDHPSDKATYTFTVTVPRGLEVVANGELSR